MQNIYNLTLKDLENYFVEQGDKKFRGTQVFEWLYRKKVKSFKEMTNLKKELLEKFEQNFEMKTIQITKVERDIDVEKYLFELKDHEKVEAVLMNHDYGNSVCISTQVGCNMGCAFCESGRLKKVRNLGTYEMVEQILLVEKDIKKRIASIVIMGIGEPLDNYDNVMDFIKIINDSKGIAIGARHITISTCGIVPKLKSLMEEDLQINLAISLHASNNELRNKLMPINKAYNLSLLMDTIKEYIEKTNRRVTIEYVMLENVNDNPNQAKELATLIKNLNVYVNLIPYNETNHLEFKRTTHEKIMKFYDTLKKCGINVTIRKEFGRKIDAACGQLRSKEVKS